MVIFDAINTAAMDDYNYLPIRANQIRLLRGHQMEDGILAGELKIFTRDSALPSFNALSYTWGEPTYNSTIRVNGKRLPLLSSLRPFLLRAFTPSSSFKDTWWWIDSICINQRDDEEKASQLPSLENIFRKAEETVVWLGEASHDSDDAINFLLFLCKINFWSQRQSDGLKAAEIADRSGKYQVQWNAVQSLFQRPWWNRVWTVQEQIVSRNQKFFCGQAHINQQKLYWAIRGIYKCHATTGLLDFSSQWNRARLLEYHNCGSDVGKCNHPRQSLIATIAYLADHDATDPRDRLFSVSGLVRDFLLCGRPSYAIPVETLYTDLVRAFIEEYNNLDIICFATIFRASIDGTSTLPSWVPDWRIKLTPLVVPLMVSQGAKQYIGNLRPCDYSDFSACYSASLDISPEIAYSPDHLKMTCTGLSVTVIEGLTKVPQALFHDGENEDLNSLPLTAYQELPMDASQLVESILRCLVLNRGDHYLNHPAPVQRYLEQFRMIVSEAMKDKLKVPPWFANWLEVNSDFPFGVVRLRKLLDAIVDNKETEEGRLPDLKDRRGFLARFYDTMVRMQRRLVLCKNGTLATVPWRARKADVICILFGCSVPVVLRELENEAFEFVGECYVDGYMDGEAIGKAKERQFVMK